MAEPEWVEFDVGDAASCREVRARVRGVAFEFGSPRPAVRDGVFHLPVAGAVCPVRGGGFLLRWVERVEQFEQGYWIGSEAYGAQWLPASDARYLDDDDRWFLGPARSVPSGWVHVERTYVARVDGGELSLKEIERDQADRILRAL